MITVQDNSNDVSIPANFTKANFGINEEDFSHIVDMIQNQLYSNKPLAVLREYSCNAYDAHAFLGKQDVPIKVVLPSKFNPQLTIRDFGCGLTYEQMLTVFTRYGKSTKRNSNDFVGCFGIGCKSAFAYTQSFMVNSYIDGKKYSYSCLLDVSKSGQLVSLGEFDTDEPNGLEIIINVRTQDINTFRELAINFYRYWDVMPNIEGFTDEDYAQMTDNNNVFLVKTDTWSVNVCRTYGNKAVAVMGNVNYIIDWDSIPEYSTFAEEVAKSAMFKEIMPYMIERFFKSCDLVLKFNIGELLMNPNRETLQYTEKTNKAIISRLYEVLTQAVKVLQAKIDAASNLWEAKLIYNNLLNSNGAFYYLSQSLKFTYKNFVIDSSSIHFSQYMNKNVAEENKMSLTMGLYRRGRLSLRNYYTAMQCRNNSAVLEVDIDAAQTYYKKAMELLHQRSNGVITEVYIIKFVSAEARNEIFAATGLDDSFVVKYSTMHNQIKQAIKDSRKHIVRTKTVDTGKRAIRCFEFDGKAYKSPLYYTHYKVTDINTVEHDMNVGGIYIETVDSGLKDSTLSMNTVLRCIMETACYNKETVKLYFIGQNIVNSRLMKSDKWVSYRDYMAKQVNKLVKSNKKLCYQVAANMLIEQDQIPSIFPSVVDEVLKWDINSDVKTFFGMQSKLKDNYHCTLTANYTPTEDEFTVVKDTYNKVIEQFPLLTALNVSMEYRGRTNENYTESMLTAIKAYLSK